MLRYLRIVEPVLYVLASVFGMVKAAQEIRTAVTEREPTFFTAERFPKEYQGQRWIGVTGRVAIAHKSSEYCFPRILLCFPQSTSAAIGQSSRSVTGSRPRSTQGK